ncbi:BON domain-containing protein [Burkholderia ubonensis]|uniref:BON domain-containing protein n=1 Tax=Burkholderia ubonensis TaxID=101571 RepID=UPI00358EDBE8
MQRRYFGRPGERGGPSEWRERNERAFRGRERDTLNYDDSLLPDDEYESSYRFASQGTDPDDWASEWGDWADRVPPEQGRRDNGGGRRGMSPHEYGGERGYGDPGRREGRYGSYGDSRYGAGHPDDAMRPGGAPDPSRFGGPGGQRRRQGPKGYTRSDERIRESVCERLASALEIDVSDVSVEVRDGRVELDGTVPARWMKHRIEDIADACMCVRDVENRVRVHRDDDERAPTVLRPDHWTVTPTENPLGEAPAREPSPRR